jgi:hypothetical protein
VTRGAEGLKFDGMHTAYPALRDLVLAAGRRVAPRGEPTVELLGASFSIDDAVSRGVPVGCGRKVGPKMMAIDGSGNLAGASYPDVAIRLAPVLGRFADGLPSLSPADHASVASLEDAYEIRTRQPGMLPGEPFFQGAYGPRIGDQLEEAERQLRRDPHTRQAVVSLWTETDRDPSWRDRPCTTQFQLMVRDGRLDIFVSMRANDLWTGTCYDVWQFGQVQAAMAHVLGMEPGTYHHYAASLHVYERDIEKFAAVEPWREEWVDVSHLGEGPGSSVLRRPVPAVDNPRETWGPDWAGLCPQDYRSWCEVRARFTNMLDAARDGVRRGEYDAANRVEQWYWDIVSRANEEGRQ